MCIASSWSIERDSPLSRQHPLVEFEFAEIKEAIELDRTVAANVGYRSLFATPGNRKRMRIIVAIAFFSQVTPSVIVCREGGLI